MSFNNYTTTQLKNIVKKFRDYHDIKGSSKMTREQLIDALDSKFRILNNKLYLHNSAPFEMPAVKETQPDKKSKANKNKLLKLKNRTEVLFNKMTAIDNFIENNNPKEKQKQTKLKQLKKMGDEYMKLADQIYSMEDSEENDKPITENKAIVEETIVNDEEPKREFSEKEKIMINMAEVSGRIKKLKNDITFEIYEPAIAKLNKKVDELKLYKQGLKDKLAKLKKK